MTIAQTYYDVVPSPIGRLLLTSDAEALTAIHLQPPPRIRNDRQAWRRGGAIIERAAAQLGAYFAGELIAFDLPLRTEGTRFQQSVWRALRAIPYGETISYAELGRRIGRPRAFRAVGLANGRNPLPIVVPCHRVIGSDGSLTGYGGGLRRKIWLLRLERRFQREAG